MQKRVIEIKEREGKTADSGRLNALPDKTRLLPRRFAPASGFILFMVIFAAGFSPTVKAAEAYTSVSEVLENFVWDTTNYYDSWTQIYNKTLFYNETSVTIGDLNPSTMFNVLGNASINNTFWFLESGRLGIGTSSPAQTLNVVGDLNVTGTSYLGSVTLTADNITVSKIIPELGDANNLTIYNATGSTIAKFKGDGQLEIWHPAGGANDYVSIYHDGADANIDAYSGEIRLKIAGTTAVRVAANNLYSGGAANTDDLGVSTVEWRGLYLGEDASSGAYFGLDQDWRLHYDEANLDRLFLNGTNAFEIVNTTSGQTIFFVNATDTRIGIGTATPAQTLNIVGDLNVTGTSYLGQLTMEATNISMVDNGYVMFGVKDSYLGWSTKQTIENTMLWSLGVNSSSLIFTQNGNREKEHDHPGQTNPTIFVHSTVDPDSDNTKWGLVTHDNTTMLIDAGDNMITLNDNTTIKGDLVVGEEGLGATLVDMYDNSTEFVIEAVHNVTFRTAKMVSADNVFRLVPIAGGSHPVTCDASSRGGLFVNNTGKDLCICGDDGWMFVSNRSGC